MNRPKTITKWIILGVLIGLMASAIGLTVIPAIGAPRLTASGPAEPTLPAPAGLTSIPAGTVNLPAAQLYRPSWSSAPPALTPEQAANLQAFRERPLMPNPARGRKMDPASPPALSESAAPLPARPIPTLPEANAPQIIPTPYPGGDALLYQTTAFGAVIPGGPTGYKSNVMEASAAQGGRTAFFTGNWFAARSTTGGAAWSFISPYADYPTFCCDQVTLYDSARDMILWYRQGAAGVVNDFKLGVSRDGGASFYTYTISPVALNPAWTNQWFDYPHLQLGTKNLYLTVNLFSAPGSAWVQSIALRIPLDALAAGAGPTINYFSVNDYFTLVPAQGGQHVAYIASNLPQALPYNRVRIYRWAENASSPAFIDVTVPAWPAPPMTCGTGYNWLSRADDRITTGARYLLQGSDATAFGRWVIGFWWTAAGGGGFTHPYIEGMAVYEDTLALAAGVQGRPLIYNTANCFAYPSFAANRRGDLAGVFNVSAAGGLFQPNTAYAIADDTVPTPPGFQIYSVVDSTNLPSDNKWGDYNTLRVFEPDGLSWTAGAHYIASATACAQCADPLFFNFGRRRDLPGWSRWQNK
jgi:hypothetical protein